MTRAGSCSLSRRPSFASTLGPVPSNASLGRQASFKRTDVVTDPESPEHVAELQQLFKFRGTVHELDLRCFSVRSLGRVVDYVQRSCHQWIGINQTGHPQVLDFETFTMNHLNDWVIRPATKCRGCAFSELLSSKRESPQWCIVHSWSERLSSFAGCLARHAALRALGEDSPFWAFVFATKAHSLDVELNEEIWGPALHKAFFRARGVLLIVDTSGATEPEFATPNSRIWCAWEQASCEVELRGSALLLDVASWPPGFPESCLLTDGLADAEARLEEDCAGDGSLARAQRELGFPMDALEVGLSWMPEKTRRATAFMEFMDAAADGGDGVASPAGYVSNVNRVDPAAPKVIYRLRASFAAAVWRHVALRGCTQRFELPRYVAADATRPDLFLDLAGCGSSLGDHDLIALAMNLPPQLVRFSIDVRGCTELTDVGIGAVARALPDTLRYLVLEFDSCNAIGVHSLAGLSESLPSGLEHLRLGARDGSRLPATAVQALGSSLPENVRSVDIEMPAPRSILRKPAAEFLICSDYTGFLTFPPISRGAVGGIMVGFSWHGLECGAYTMSVHATLIRDAHEIISWELLTDSFHFETDGWHSSTGRIGHCNPLVKRISTGDVVSLKYQVQVEFLDPDNSNTFGAPWATHAERQQGVQVRDIVCVMPLVPVDDAAAYGPSAGFGLEEGLKAGKAKHIVDLSGRGTEQALPVTNVLSMLHILRLDRAVLELVLDGLPLSPPASQFLARVVETNVTLRRLSVQGCKLDAHGGDLLANAMMSNSSLQSLSVSNNMLGSKVAISFGQALRANCALTSLDAGGCHFGAAGAGALSAALVANTTLRYLSLPGNYFGDAGVRSIANMLATNSTLRTLDVAGNAAQGETASAFLQSLSVNRSLEELNLGENRISSKDMGVSSLMQVFRHNGVLRKLVLDGNLVDASVDGALSEGLSRATELVDLSLNNNSLRAEGARDLADGLRTNESVHSLHLESNGLGDEGVRLLAAALEENPRVTRLWLKGNSCGDEAAVALAKALSFYTYRETMLLLDLSNNFLGVQGALALATALHANCNLQALHVSSNNFADDGAEALALAIQHNYVLTELSIASNRIEARGARALAQSLAHNHRLQSLDLSSNNLGAYGGNALAEALRTNRHLKELHLRAAELGESVVTLLDALRCNHGLTVLDLGGNFIGDMSAPRIEEALAQNRQLRELRLNGCAVVAAVADGIATALRSNSFLEKLDLDHNFVRQQGALALAASLSTNPSMHTVSLRNNPVGETGAEALATVAKFNHSIVSMPGVYDGRHDADPTMRQKLDLALLANSCLVQKSHMSCFLAGCLPASLSRLRLDFAFIPDVSDEDMSLLARSIRELHALRSLDLSVEGCPRVGDDGCSSFVGCFPRDVGELAFNFSFCQCVSDAGLFTIVVSLPTKLQSFSMRAIGTKASGNRCCLDLPNAYAWRRDARMHAAISWPPALVQMLQHDTELVKAEDAVLAAFSKSIYDSVVDTTCRAPWIPVGTPSAMHLGSEAARARAYGHFVAENFSARGGRRPSAYSQPPAGYPCAQRPQKSLHTSGSIEGLRAHSVRALQSQKALHGSRAWRPSSARPSDKVTSSAPRRPASAGPHRSPGPSPAWARSASNVAASYSSGPRRQARRMKSVPAPIRCRPVFVPRAPSTAPPAARRPVLAARRANSLA